jgi:hypothetical protein
MLPPAMTMDRGMGAGNDEARQRLHEFRQHHKGMGWFYRLLDVPYGIEMATSDVARFSTPAAITAALIFDSLIALIFGLIWWRYDLMSTWTTLDPLATGLTTAANTLLTGLKLPPQVGAVVGWVVATLIRVAVTLGPSIIQFRMPYDASRHDAAWLALWGTAIFDMGTDSVDIRTDVPTFFGWLQGAATNADSAALGRADCRERRLPWMGPGRQRGVLGQRRLLDHLRQLRGPVALLHLRREGDDARLEASGPGTRGRLVGS